MSKKNTIKKYNNYYIYASDLCSWGIKKEVITDCEDDHFSFKYKILGVDTDNELYNSYDIDGFFIEVRYLGHGIFREVLTNKTILAVADGKNNFEDKAYFDENNDKFIRTTLFDLNDYIKYINLAYGEHTDVHSFGKSIVGFQQTVDQTALVLNPRSNIVHINKEHEASYKELSDEKRIELINEISTNAEKSRIKVYNKLMYAAGMSLNPSKEFIDAAYRENEKRSLALKSGKTKKDSK